MSKYTDPNLYYYRMLNPYYSNEHIKSPYLYDQDRIDDVIAEMYFPKIVVAGSKLDVAQQYGFGKAYEMNHKRENGTTYTSQDRSHFFPTLGYSLIAFGESTPEDIHALLKHISEELPHAFAYANGDLDLAEMGLDLLLYGGSGQNTSYRNRGAMEGFTHAIGSLSENKKDKEAYENLLNVKKTVKDLGLENLIVDFNNDGKKDYVVPGFTNGLHSPLGEQYWLEAYLRKNIDKNTRDKAMKIISKYHKKERNDAFYDQAWNTNKDDWAEQARKLGVTDGGDVARFMTPIFNSLNFFIENTNIIALKEMLQRKKLELEKDFKDKKIDKNLYNKLKKQYKLADESLNKKAYATVGENFTNAVKETKQGNFKQAAKSTGKGLFKIGDSIAGMGQSGSNIATNFIANLLTLGTKKAIKEKTYAATDYVMNKSPLWFKDANKKANPYAKKAIATVWNWIPSGSYKDGLKDNKIMRFGRDWLKRYGLWKKNGGVLNILDMLIY